MPKYQNIAFTGDKSRFVDVASSVIANFSSKKSTVRVSTSAQDVVTFDVLVEKEKSIQTDPACTPCNAPVLNNTVRLRATVFKGDSAELAAMRLELNRLVDVAIADYALLAGLVPPSNATFASE